jgi:hypothetical protein
LSGAVAEEYRSLIAEAKQAGSDPSRRTVDRLRRELHAIEARDRFGVKEREQARRAMERLAGALYAIEEEAAR